MNNKLIILAILLFISFSCKTKKELVKRTDLASKNELFAELVLDSLSENSLKYNSLYLKFSASVDSEKGKINSPGSIKILKDSLIILSLTPMLGIELLRAKVTKNEIVVLNRLNKTYYREEIGAIQKLFGVSLSFFEIEKILTNKIFSYPENLSIKKEYEYSNIQENNKKLSKFNYSGILSDTIVYKHSLRIADLEKRYNSFDINFINLQKSVKVNYTNFKELNSIDFPYSIEIETLDGKYSIKLNIEFTKVETNKKLNYSFSIPKKYKKKKLLGF